MDDSSSDIKGHLIVLMAPSGSGKGTLVKYALEKYPEVEMSVSCTSRTKRPSETDGKHYHFLTPEVFEEKIRNDEFLEWAEFAGNKYGTLKNALLEPLRACKVVLAEIEVQGVEQLLTILPKDHMTVVYVDAGDWDILSERIESRAPISVEELEKRRQRFFIERENKSIADVIINNIGGIDIAKSEFEQVIVDAASKCQI